MRVALDIRYHTASGASNYISNLVPRLLEANTDFEFVLLRFADQHDCDDLPLESIPCTRLHMFAQVIWDQAVLPFVLRGRGIDLYHPLKFLGCLRRHCPQISVGHSITAPFRGDFPSSRRALAYWSTLGNRLYRRSSHVIAVSQYVRDFLVEVLSVPPERVTVVYNGKDARFRQYADVAKPPELQLTVDGPFILGVGNLFPVKNQLTTVQAFARIAERLADHKLVLAGGTTHPYFAEVSEAVDRAALRQRVQFPGFVDPNVLLYLYNRADALVMPSLTEGCPITLLEAMACGLPVVGSRRGGIAELGGEAIRLVDDPHDTEAWAAAMLDVVTDTATRARMTEASLSRAAEFTWERTGRETLAVYQRVLATNGA
jgi:glycosyltransferase involved in cell wall biosynthesis